MTSDHLRKKLKEGPNGEAKWVVLFSLVLGVVMALGMIWNTGRTITRDFNERIDKKFMGQREETKAIGERVLVVEQTCSKLNGLVPEIHADVRELREYLMGD